MAKHSDLTPTLGIHVPYAWSYADETAREAASGFVSGDVGKLARQEDDNSLWMLTGTTPDWSQVSSGGSGVPSHAATHKGGGADVIDSATQSVSGLLSAADKVKLDLLGSGILRVLVRNETGAQIDKGTLVAGGGWDTGEDRALIVVADKDDPDARPAIGVMEANIADNANGEALIAGHLYDVDTSAWDVTDQLVLGNSGAFSRPPPDQDPFTGEVQNVGVVVRDDASEGVIHFLPDGQEVVTATQAFALAGSYGTPSKTNPFVTDSDPRLTKPPKVLTVGSVDADYTSIKDAIDAAVTGGASAASPWQIKIYPGTYTEAPMTVVPGITLAGEWANRIDGVFVVASNASEDLFTCTGGYISSLRVSGVSDSAKALFRMATASTLTVLHGISVRDCSTGIAVSNGASVIMTSFSIQLNGVGQGVTTGISATGSGTYIGIVGGFVSAPAALLPGYTGNPIQTVIRNASSARVFIVGVGFDAAPKDTTADIVLGDGGSITTLLSCEVSNSGTAVHIGSGGSDTKIIAQACSFLDNYLNGDNDSATGVVMVSATADDFKWESVAGGILSGIAHLQDYDTTFLMGTLSYWFSTGAILSMNGWIHDQSSTALAYPDTPVTEDSGLDVDVPAAHGVIVQHDPDHDAQSAEWDADTLTLDASTTNYVVYSLSAGALDVLNSPPGNEAILLATAVTDSTGIRFLHQTRMFEHSEMTRLHEYLLTTRKLLLKSGLAVTAGTSGRKFQVGSGYYYRALDVIAYAGSGGDAGFSSFYGSGGASEVSGQTEVNNTQYDSSGTLTSMTSGYFRSDTVVLTSDGRVSVIFGTEEFSTQLLAESAGLGNIPSFIEETGLYVARLVVEEGGDIESIVDERPTGASSGSGGTAVTVHADLAGLSADDHTQYLLASGARAMTGNLDMGANTITNVGNVDGVDVSDHSARHIPGGADALTLGTPVATQVGATAAEGTAASFARSDHQHGVGAGTPVAVGTANAAGSSSNVARADHVHSGLKRDANDFSAFSTKASPVGADLLLIEDSADSGNKKRISMSVLPAGVDTTAIHKATDAEISAMTAKTSPVDADILVIEDSSDGYSKKKVTLANVIAAASVFGQQAQNGESLSSSTTTSSWIQKLRVTTASLPSGLYRIGWSCELRMRTTVSYDAKVRVQINDTTTLAEGIVECKDTNSYYPFGGFGYHTGSGVLNLDMDFGSESASHTAEIRNARIEIWRVS